MAYRRSTAHDSSGALVLLFIQPDLAQLDALSRAVSEGTFEAAARALHVTPSAVSQRIKALERSTGQILLSREKPVRPTPAGESLLRLAVQIRALIDDAARHLGAASPGAAPEETPVVPLAVNADSLATWVLPALAGLSTPAVFDLHRDDQEHTVDLLRRGTVVAAITSDLEPVAGCTVERLGTMVYRPLASPASLDGGSPPARPQRRWPPPPSSSSTARTPCRTAICAVVGALTPARRASTSPASTAFHQAVLLGLGWGMLPDQQANNDVRDGSLIEIDPGATIDVRLHWQQWRIHSALLGEVADAIRQAARATLSNIPARRQSPAAASHSSSPA